MPTCSFCGSTLEVKDTSYYCCFCDLELVSDQIQKNGLRRQVSLEQAASLGEANQSTKELIQKDSYYLTCLLRLVRQERTRIYNYLRIFNRANKQQADFVDQAQDMGERYEYWTRKMWVIENILRDRAGCFPERITDNYLRDMAENIEKSNCKPMHFVSRKKE